MDASLQDLVSRLDRISGEFHELREGIRQAIALADLDPEMSLTRSRKILEYVVRDVYERRVQEPPGTRPLENLLQRLVKDEYVPRRVAAYANAVRDLGNVGTHSFADRITKSDVAQSVTQLMQVLEWYFEHERQQGALEPLNQPGSEPASNAITTVPKTTLVEPSSAQAPPTPGQPSTGGVPVISRRKRLISVVAAMMFAVACGLFFLLVHLHRSEERAVSKGPQITTAENRSNASEHVIAAKPTAPAQTSKPLVAPGPTQPAEPVPVKSEGPVTSVEGTVWRMGGKSAVRFETGGKTSFTDNSTSGNWEQLGNEIKFDCNNYSFYDVAMSGDQMSGTVRRGTAKTGVPATLRRVKKPSTSSIEGTTWKFKGTEKTIQFLKDGRLECVNIATKSEGKWDQHGEFIFLQVPGEPSAVVEEVGNELNEIPQLVPLRTTKIALEKVIATVETNPPPSIEGTVWRFADGDAVKFLKGGRSWFTRTNSGGSWEQNGKVVKFDINDYTLYEVLITGDKMKGTFRRATETTTRPTGLTRVTSPPSRSIAGTVWKLTDSEKMVEFLENGTLDYFDETSKSQGKWEQREDYVFFDLNGRLHMVRLEGDDMRGTWRDDAKSGMAKFKKVAK